MGFVFEASPVIEVSLLFVVTSVCYLKLALLVFFMKHILCPDASLKLRCF